MVFWLAPEKRTVPAVTFIFAPAPVLTSGLQYRSVMAVSRGARGAVHRMVRTEQRQLEHPEESDNLKTRLTR